MIRDNAYYGHRELLAAYVGLEDAPPIWAYLQHGWNDGTGFPVDHDLSRLLPKLVWSEATAGRARSAGLRPVTAIGAPFLYLLRTCGEPERRTSATPRTIVYPYHSSEWAEIVGSQEQLSDVIADREVGAVTVCLYWREYDDPRVRAVYERHGFEVICHGRRYTRDFLVRQREALLDHTRLVTNRVSTALWYGGALGLALEVYGPVFGVSSAREGDDFSRTQSTRWPDLCGGGLGAESARELALSELGEPSLRSRQDLAEILGWTGLRRTIGGPVRYALQMRHRLLGNEVRSDPET